MEHEENDGTDGISIRVPTSDDYRTCSNCGGDCYPDPAAGTDGLGVRIALICPSMA